MKRFAMILIGLLMSAAAVVAQQVPATLPPPATPATLPEVMAPEVTPPVAETTVEAVPDSVNTPLPTPVPLSVEATEALPILVSARGDLELLADAALGDGQRPAGWSGSIDVSDANLPLLIRLDLETLAGAVLGNEARPEGWFGVVASSPLAIARDIRHDLELLADTVVGASTIRPGMWVGDDPLMRCNRATQALVPLLERSGFSLDVDFNQPGVCREIEVQASRWVETQIIQPPVVGGVVLGGVAQPYLTETPFVVAFYDTNANRRAGVLPVGTGFRPVSRSGVDFSNMMLIDGEGFSLYVDYTTTPVTLAEFESLPEVSLGTTTSCTTDWCSQ